jgi:1-acyl-sn-glycerol-3-phosphate acyltransferase
MIRVLGILSMLVACILTVLGTVLVMIFVVFGLHRHIDHFVQYWARSMNFLSRVKVTVTGIENLPEEPALYVFNHLSAFDIPLIFAAIPRKLRFGAKKELFYVPFLGWAMKMMGIIRIDRNNRAQAIGELQKAIIKMRKEHLNIILAPEGTRQKEIKIGAFKTGPFLTAIQAQVPVVPIVLKGVHDVLPKGHYIFRLEKDHHCHIEVLPPIPTKGLTEDERHELKTLVYEKMSKAFQKS